MQRIYHCIRNRRGQSSLELGLALPILLLLVIGMFDIGLYVYQNTLANEAARAGARMAVVTADNTLVAQAIAKAAPLQLEDLSTPLPSTARKTGDEVKVVVEGKHKMITPLFGGMLGADEQNRVIVHGEATMRME